MADGTIYATRSQVARYARRLSIPNFMSVRVPNRGWKLFEMPAGVPEAVEYAAGKDWVSHVEVHHIDEGRKPGYRAVLVVTCFKDDLPSDIPFDVEPITPSMWDKEGDTNFEHRAKNAGPAVPRAKSDVQSPTKLVWEIADSMPGVEKKEVIAACVARGVNPSTAATQYYRWNKAKSA